MSPAGLVLTSRRLGVAVAVTLVACTTSGCASSDATRGASGTIVFFSGADSRTHAMRPDGTGRRRFRAPPGYLSPDRRLRAIVERAPGRATHATIYVAARDGGNRRLVARIRHWPAEWSSVHWSPDGRRFVYEISDDGFQGTYLVDVNDPRFRRIEVPSGAWRGDSTFAGWSPDGGRMVIGNAEGDYAPWFMVDIASGRIRGLPFLRTATRVVAWTRTGRILYRTAAGGLFSVKVDGTDRRDLAPTLAVQALELSPDGRLVAVIGRRGGRGGDVLYLVRSDGTGRRRVRVPDGGSGRLALEGNASVFSPDGTKMAFTRRIDGNWEVYVADVDGTEATNVSRNDAQDRFPAWSPDGAKVAFDSKRDGHSQIYLVNADGSGLTNLSHDRADESLLYWLAGSR